SALLSTNSIPRIQQALQQALQESGWSNNLRAYILQLLRSGECTTYDDVMRRVLDETRHPDKSAADADGAANGDSKNGDSKLDKPDIKVPEKAVREGIRAVRREVETVCDVT
ncbi:uncharacterized protein K452DRAFT_192864, partial [Aplosporella prunicola CBS 121167]